MGNLEKISFIGLLLLALLLAGFLVYYHKELMQPASVSINPFDPNRVAQIRIIMKEDDWQRLKKNVMAKSYFRADFWFDNQLVKNVAIRPKGNSSLMSATSGTDRLPLKVDFNFFNSAQEFRGIKKLALNNGFSDPTFIRETISYELFDQMGLPTPRRAFADVWVNDIHLGLYTIVEQIDKAFLRKNFANPEGNLYKPEMPAAYLNWTKDDLDKQSTQESQLSENKKKNNLDIKIGGSRLGDLVTVLKREGVIGSEMLPDDAAVLSAGGPGGMFPGGPPGQFPGDPNRPFARGPGGRFPMGPPGQFVGDPNRPFTGGFRGRGSFPGRPGEPNRPFARGPEGQFPGGPPGRFPRDPNGPFARGPGRQFPGDPNRSFAGGFRGRGGFPGGPGGPFGRGGNLLEQMGLKTNENYSDYSALFRFLEVLNKCPDDTFASEIEKVLDVDEFLRFLAVSVLIVHLDNYIGMGHNYYLYEADGKFCVIPWDLNMAFGTFGMGVGRGTSIVDFYIDEPTTGAFTERPLVTRLLKHKPYLDKYHQYLEQLLNGSFAEGVIEARIDKLVELIRPFVEADDLKFFSTEDFEKSINEGLASRGQGGFSPRMDSPEGFTEDPGRLQGQMEPFGGPRGRGAGPAMFAPGLKSFIKQRRLSVREQLDGKIPSRSES